MKMMIIGTGGVGESILKVLKERDPEGAWLEQVVLADFDLKRAEQVSRGLGDETRFIPAFLDAKKSEDIVSLIKKYRVDFVMDAASNFLTDLIFDASYEAKVNYMNMGTWSDKGADPYHKGFDTYMTEHNFSQHENWVKNNNMAILGMGIDPGVVDVFAIYAAQNLFDEVYEVHIRDGGNLEVEGAELAFGFNVYTVIDECLTPNIEWNKDEGPWEINGQKGYIIGEPFTGEEIFEFPEGIGPNKLYKTEHEEEVFIPRYLEQYGLKKCTFKIALDDDVVNALEVIRQLGLDRMDQVNVGGVEVVPREVVAAVAPQPLDLGENMTGKMCVGMEAIGIKDGKQRHVFIYQPLDNRDSMERLNMQAVVAQTGLGAAIAIELIGTGVWNKPGVHAPEAFDPMPYLALMREYDFPYYILEKDSEYKEASQ